MLFGRLDAAGVEIFNEYVQNANIIIYASIYFLPIVE